MEPPTPRLAQLAFRLAVELSELQRQTEKLMHHLHIDTEECLVLQKALHNVVDRKKEKENHKKRWRVAIKEIIETPIDYESLDEI
jgi:hypothetical protein